MTYDTPHLTPATHDMTTGNPLRGWDLARIASPEQTARELVELVLSLRGCSTHQACIHAQRAVTNTERSRDYDLSQPARHAAHTLRKLAELVNISGDVRLASLTPLPEDLATERPMSPETGVKTGDPCESCGTSYVECTKRVLAPGGRSYCSRCFFTDTHTERVVPETDEFRVARRRAQLAEEGF